MKKKIGNALYAIAIALLIIGLYQKGANIENRFFDVAGYIALIVAAAYHFGISRHKSNNDANS